MPRTRRYHPTAVPGSYARRTPGPTGLLPSASCLACLPAGPARFYRPCWGDRSRQPPSAAWPRPRTSLSPPSPTADSTTATSPSCLAAWRRRHQASHAVVVGLLPDGRKGIIDFQIARGESAAEWDTSNLPPSARPHRRRPRNDLCGRRQRPPRRPAPCPSRHPRSTMLGPQDPKHPQQTPETRPGGRQTRPPQHHDAPPLRAPPHAASPTGGGMPI